jgi:hypothetical protein
MIRQLHFSKYVLLIRSIGPFIESVKENSFPNECFLLVLRNLKKHFCQASIGGQKGGRFMADLWMAFVTQ